jgi:hypothetical protein
MHFHFYSAPAKVERSASFLDEKPRQDALLFIQQKLEMLYRPYPHYARTVLD